MGRTSWRHRHPMQHLGTEYVSTPGDAALVEQRCRAALRCIDKDLHLWAVAFLPVCKPGASSAGWERK